MKTRLLIIIGIIVISAIVISYSYGYIPFDEHYKIEITGLKDIYTTDDIYSFDYHITGIGDSCAEITVMYPDENGETLTRASIPGCAAERSLRVPIDRSSFHGPLGNIAIKIPDTYEISVTYEPIGSILSATTIKQFEVIDDFDATFGGPGNRHPAFLGYEIPRTCTENMIKHLVKHSNMFFADEDHFYINFVGLPDSVNEDDYDICFDELLKLRETIKYHSGDIPITENTEPEPIPQPGAIEERFHGTTKSQIENIQLAELGCKKIGNQTYCDIMVQEKIDYYLQQNHGEIEIDAKKLLQIAYYENVNLGPLKINDVIVGFGIENDTMIMDVLYRYSTSSEMDIAKKKIRNIVGDEIKIEYIPYKEPLRFIQNALVYHWNEYLHKNNIEFAPAYPSHGNNDDGIGDCTFLCSPLVAPNGTEFYIVSTVIVEPFLITDTFIDIEKPEFCRKTWKTDVILEEPGRVISLWLEMGQGKIPN